MSFDFYFDVGSPTTYVAWHKAKRAVAHSGITIRKVPILLGGVFKSADNASPMACAAKAAYLRRDIARAAEAEGIPFIFNSRFPINTVKIMRGAIAAERVGVLDAYCDIAFECAWARDVDLTAFEALRSPLEGAGVDYTKIESLSADPEVKAKLVETTEEASSRGAFGAPTFFVDGEMFFGQDRFENALAHALP